MLKLSTMVEAQADADGMRFVARAGFAPLAFLEFLNIAERRNRPAAAYAKVGYPPPQVHKKAVQRITAAENLQAIARQAHQTLEAERPLA